MMAHTEERKQVIMVARIFLLAALVCAATSNPLGMVGQTTVCDSGPNLLSSIIPNYGTTTVCETGPGVLPYYPYSLPTVYDTPNPLALGLGGLGYGLPYPGLPGQTTVCETAPNVVGWGGLGYLGGLGYPYGLGLDAVYPGLGLGYGYGLPVGLNPLNPLGSTTVCDTAPNFGLGYGYGLPVGLNPLNPLGSTTVCDTSPNLLGLGYPYPGLGLPVAGMAPGSTTVCESSPNLLGLGLPFGRAFL